MAPHVCRWFSRPLREFFGKAPNRSVNPDEVVALGAAVQGGVLSQDITDVLLLDVTPLNLGIETLGGVTTVLIEANTTVPAKKQEIFSTAADNQTSVEVHVLQGNRQMAMHNRTIGRFHLQGIPPTARGLPQIEVSFDIDADGILNVTAKDQATGKEQSIRIEADSGLSEAEIERMRDQAKEHAEEDQQIRDQVDKLNQADSLVYAAEKALTDIGDKLSDESRSAVESALQDLKTAHADKDFDRLDSASSALEKAVQAAHAEAMSQQQKGQGSGPFQGGGDGQEVSDVEYEDVSEQS